jgi:hypothetical protein
MYQLCIKWHNREWGVKTYDALASFRARNCNHTGISRLVDPEIWLSL